MKRQCVNVFATTGLSLIIISIVALMYKAEFLCISTVFEVFGVNVFMHLGLFMANKVDYKYWLAELMAGNFTVILVLVIFGILLNWFSYVPIWVLVIMGIAVYFLSSFLNLFRMQHEAKEINDLLRKRDIKTYSESDRPKNTDRD